MLGNNMIMRKNLRKYSVIEFCPSVINDCSALEILLLS
ncbi:MAG: hypothetical protein P857_816 [Candidatus Xenolissoclinum pacificiensis L6]|uniref:Uncharacterized protein n=1 Tax=Candidatus Xenolissoclinum pacificiensis L6 TaxID=1401685 RepID=W2UZQ3_9RICK|nr:MAG: hypothetical protein P857_816 [Candidatus Xenolissoclinum pacificiensis L6]